MLQMRVTNQVRVLCIVRIVCIVGIVCIVCINATLEKSVCAMGIYASRSRLIVPKLLVHVTGRRGPKCVCIYSKVRRDRIDKTPDLTVFFPKTNDQNFQIAPTMLKMTMLTNLSSFLRTKQNRVLHPGSPKCSTFQCVNWSFCCCGLVSWFYF